MLAGREWLSDRYSVVDPYGFVFYTWACAASCRWRSSRATGVQGSDAQTARRPTGRGAREDQGVIRDRLIFAEKMACDFVGRRRRDVNPNQEFSENVGVITNR
jgi:hypothetical protein